MNNLRIPERVGKLRQTLQAKAKGHPSYRFYSLYDKVSRRDVLVYAWARCRRNGGVAGVDGQTFEEIEASKRWGHCLTVHSIIALSKAAGNAAVTSHAMTA